MQPYVQATKEKNHKHTLYWAKQPRYNNLISITFYDIQRKLREIVDKLKDLCYNYKYNRDGTIKYIEIYKNSNFVIHQTIIKRCDRCYLELFL